MGGWAATRSRGGLGDALHAVMYGAGHNLRLILTVLRLYCACWELMLKAVIAALNAAVLKHRSACG